MNQSNENASGSKPKRGGRPKKEPSQKRDHNILCAFTKSEYDSIRNDFEQSTYKYLAEFVYHAIKGRNIVVKRGGDFPDDLKRDFKNMANNINQIAAVLNTRKHDPVALEMLEKLKLLTQQFTYFASKIKA